MVENSSTQNYDLGPVSVSVHGMGGLSRDFGPVSTWTEGRTSGPHTAVFVRGGLVYHVFKLLF